MKQCSNCGEYSDDVQLTLITSDVPIVGGFAENLCCECRLSLIDDCGEDSYQIIY